MLDEAGRLAGPLVLVDLDGSDPRVPPADGRLVIGVARNPLPDSPGEILDRLDLALVPEALAEPAVPRQCVAVPDPAAAAAALGDAVTRFPHASVVLGQVLRATQTLPVLTALDVESFAYSTLLGGAEFRRWLAGRGERSQPGLVTDPVLRRGAWLTSPSLSSTRLPLPRQGHRIPRRAHRPGLGTNRRGNSVAKLALVQPSVIGGDAIGLVQRAVRGSQQPAGEDALG